MARNKLAYTVPTNGNFMFCKRHTFIFNRKKLNKAKIVFCVLA